jgi:hypothetical protein
MSKDSKQSGTLKVEGIEYFWEFRHATRFDSNVGLCGPSVVVCLRPTQTRDLIIDFPYSTFDPKGKPRRAILMHHLTSVIRSALAIGWEPESRGKPFRFNVTDTDSCPAA